MNKVMHINKKVLIYVVGFTLLFLLINLNQVFASDYDSVHYINKCMKITEPGKYIINESLSVDPKEKICLEINASNVEIDGRMNKIFGFFELGSKAILISGNNTNILSDIKIKNLIIDGGYAGIKLKYTKNIQIEAVFFKNPLEGLIIEDSSKVFLRNSRINAKQRALIGTDSISLEIQNNIFSSEYSHCIDLKESYYPLIRENKFLYCKGSAIRLEKIAWLNVYENSIKNSGKGIEVINSSSPVIELNYVENSTQHSISILHSSNAKINNNNLNISQVGVFAQYSQQIFANSNTINEVDVGFLIDHCLNVTIKNSKVNNMSKNLFLVKQSRDLLLDYGNIKGSKSLIEDSNVSVSLKQELIENNIIYKDNATVTFLVINESKVIKTENIDTLLVDKENISIQPKKTEKESLLEKISVKHAVILMIVILILVLIYSEIKLLNEKQYRRKRKRK